jgi:hypothetical protein
MTTARTRRATALVGAGAAVAVALAGAAVTSAGPAVSAPPAGDCAAPYPTAALITGQPVTGLTVSSGTTPAGFTGEVLGVIDDGIGPGLDMIMARLTSPEIDRVGGIWQGMSGSPVYAADGRLIGAVAYGLAFGPSPVAGITPFDDMNDYLGAPAAKVDVPKATARRVADAAGVSRDQASQGFAQLRIPYGVSGVRASRLASLPDRPYRDKDLMVATAGALAPGPGAETMVAGGNIAAALAYGDITQGGVGTVTSVCGSRVVGFGHPMAFLGATTLSLHPAAAVYVQEDPVSAPFKVANFGPVVGTITDDRLTGISGTFDALSATTGVTSALTFGTRSRTGSTRVAVPLAAPDITLFQILANHDRLLDGITKGTELQQWTITGKRPDGTPFSLARTDRYTSTDLAVEVPFDVADAVFNLGQFEGVTLADVSVSGGVTTDARTRTVSKVKVKTGKKWRTAKPGGKVDARAGHKLRLRVVLTGPAGKRVVPVSLKVPARAFGAAFLSVTGGNDYFSEVEFSEEDGGFFGFATLDDYLDAQRATVRNDAVAADLIIEGRRSVRTKHAVSRPQDQVVKGFLEFTVRIR